MLGPYSTPLAHLVVKPPRMFYPLGENSLTPKHTFVGVDHDITDIKFTPWIAQKNMGERHTESNTRSSMLVQVHNLSPQAAEAGE